MKVLTGCVTRRKQALEMWILRSKPVTEPALVHWRVLHHLNPGHSLCIAQTSFRHYSEVLLWSTFKPTDSNRSTIVWTSSEGHCLDNHSYLPGVPRHTFPDEPITNTTQWKYPSHRHLVSASLWCHSRWEIKKQHEKKNILLKAPFGSVLLAWLLILQGAPASPIWWAEGLSSHLRKKSIHYNTSLQQMAACY